MPSEIKIEAAKDAETFLKATWFGGIPVDPVAIASRSGVRVVYAPLDSETLGAFLKRPNEEPTILINEADPENRKRFTCAHELGHFNKRKDETGEYHTIDLRGPLSSTGSDREEVYANEFAACLLMPADDLKIFLQLGLSDEELAERFKVSREAMEYRLVNLFLPR
ncbi:MAG: ImmA/IrrE family metallo-endopeptidase [Solirubrobacteraceae bacterium]